MKQEKQVKEMKQHPISEVLLSHKGSDLIAFVATVMTLRICACPTFWTQHKSYASERYRIIRNLEKKPMLRAIIDQFEAKYPDRKVTVVKDKQYYVRFVTSPVQFSPDAPTPTKHVDEAR